MRKILAFLLTLALLTSLAAVPACASEAYASARTFISGDANAASNIECAARAISRTTLRYGETFSFNRVIGPVSWEDGYLVSADGRGAQVTGGGIAQAASCLYIALLNLDNDGVSFDSVTNYGDEFTGGYVFDYAYAVAIDSDTDFVFTNYAADELFIEMWISNGYLYCSVALSNAVTQAASSWDPFRSDLEWNQRIIAESTIRCGADSRILTNVQLAANSIHDTILSSGDVFSFNDIVGPRESDFGYVSATNGRGVQVVGGGVAQVASAIWLAIRDMDDISIVEKSTYGTRYTQSYVRSSADAILTDYNAGTDFAFRYTGSGSITLYTYLDGDTLICQVSRTD